MQKSRSIVFICVNQCLENIEIETDISYHLNWHLCKNFFADYYDFVSTNSRIGTCAVH